jgi:RND family efflux transporter MFP subunit
MHVSLPAIKPMNLLLASVALAATTSLAQQVLPVKVTPVAARNFERRFLVQGSLQTKNFANVAARTGGNLDAIWVDDGDRVEAGKTVLFQVDPVAQSNAVTAAEQDLAVARAACAVSRAASEKTAAESLKAERDFKRYSRLHEKGTVTDNEFEIYETAYIVTQAALRLTKAEVELAEARVVQAEAALRIAQKDLEDTRIFAPISGIVNKRAAEPGEHLAAGQVVLRIDDPTVVEAVAYLPATLYPEAEPGKATFRLSADREDLGSHPIVYRSPTIDPILRTFEVKGLIENNPAAIPGNMASFSFVFEKRDGLAVPDASIVARLNRSVVFVVKDGKANMRDVKAGLRNDGWTEILEGLAEGEQILVEGQSQATDGVAVDIR